MSQKIILDCDPGIDDACAIALAIGHPGLDLVGVTTVAGNVGLEQTTLNAVSVCEFAGAPPTLVTPGCAAPLLRAALDAREVHGESGLGGARLPAPAACPADGHAVDYIIDTVAAAPGEITLVATAPLTNIALAVRREPKLVTQVKDFVIMGGSSARGNVTPAAEYNIWADPEAAAIVFGAGWTVTMIGLDVTLQARATAAVRDRLRTLGPLADDLLIPALDQYISGPGDPPIHDACAVAYVAQPELFGRVPAHVDVEVSGRWTSGMTITDFDAPAADHNAQVAMTIDVPAFWDLMLDAYSRIDTAKTAR